MSNSSWGTLTSFWKEASKSFPGEESLGVAEGSGGSEVFEFMSRIGVGG